MVQGIQYYKNITDNDTLIPGLMNPVLGGYKISDIEIVVAYDIDMRKVGKHLEEAIFQPPNNTKIFYRDIPKTNVIVKMGVILDGFSPHLLDYDEKYRIILSKEQEPSKEDIIEDLKRSGCQILLRKIVGNTAEIIKVDVNEHHDIVREWKVDATPTLQLKQK